MIIIRIFIARVTNIFLDILLDFPFPCLIENKMFLHINLEDSVIFDINDRLFFTFFTICIVNNITPALLNIRTMLLYRSIFDSIINGNK